MFRMQHHSPVRDGNTTLVTCHSNADFDSFAAMLAAATLYAPCDLLFPGTQEKNLHKLYESVLDEIGELASSCTFVEPSSLDRTRYTLLVVVDTRQRSRLPHVWPLLDNPGIRVEAWDHHPDTADDIHPHTTHFSNTGAVTTALVFQLKERGYTLLPQAATILGMGIYSDTGAFSYSSVTCEDFEAASWLLRQGMDVNAITDQLSFEMTRTHVQALNSLLESCRTYNINGEQVVLAETTLEHYLGDFAYLAHKLMEMEKFPVLFALGRMDDRIQVVARSRFNANSSINVGTVCSAVGGGGHAYAASASIRDKTLSQVRDALINALYMQRSGEKTASDYMSSPAIGIENEHTMGEAEELMVHFGLKSVPVFARGTRHCVGIMDGRVTQRAVLHGLGDEKIDDYMLKPVVCLPPDASLRDLTNVIVGQRQRMVPIVRDNDVVGVVTRTDLIGIFAAEPGMQNDEGEDESGRAVKKRNLTKSLKEQLSPAVYQLLCLVADLGREIKTPVYVVGGFVRDLLLKAHNTDIDLVVEGDGIAFAEALAKRLRGRTRVHRAFLTACVLYEDEKGHKRRVDVASTRLEYYESPAALPTVEHSSIKMDLYRRDFTINALALRLDCEPMGQIVDFFGGQRDIKDKCIRVLHTLSFVEDPSRVLRGVRFEQRYRFRLGPDTEKLVRNALARNLLDKLSPGRIFHEFEAICNEEHALLILLRLQELGVLQNLHPLLTLTTARQKSVTRMARVMAWYRLLYLDVETRSWFVYFLGLTTSLSYSDTLSCFMRLGLPATHKKTVMQGREQARYVRPQLRRMYNAGEPTPSAVCSLVRLLPMECLLWLLAEETKPEVRRALSRYITTWRTMTPDLNGDDLKRMGLPAGPDCGVILRRLLTAKLDHVADTAQKQYALARELVIQALNGTLEKDETHQPHTIAYDGKERGGKEGDGPRTGPSATTSPEGTEHTARTTGVHGSKQQNMPS